jgi:hypothetical protein
MLTRLVALTFLISLLLGVPSLAAQSAMSGTVREDGSGRPLLGVEVILEGTGRAATTAENGRYLLSGLTPGRTTVVFRMVGYLPVRVPVLLVAGDTLRANATLIASEVVLDPIVVEGKPSTVGVGMGREAFDERRRLGFGRFYDSATLRESEHLRLDDLLRRQGGVAVVQQDVEGDRKWIAFHPSRRGPGGDLNCAMQVYHNGVKVGVGGILNKAMTRAQGRVVDPPDLRMFDLSSLHAVEVYRSAAQVPQEYGGSTAGCGVILLWSRQAP